MLLGWFAVARQVANIRSTAAVTQSNIAPIQEVTPLAQMEEFRWSGEFL